jgi:hypothetical protein
MPSTSHSPELRMTPHVYSCRKLAKIRATNYRITRPISRTVSQTTINNTLLHRNYGLLISMVSSLQSQIFSLSLLSLCCKRISTRKYRNKFILNLFLWKLVYSKLLLYEKSELLLLLWQSSRTRQVNASACLPQIPLSSVSIDALLPSVVFDYNSTTLNTCLQQKHIT